MYAAEDKTQVHVLEFILRHSVPRMLNTELEALMSALPISPCLSFTPPASIPQCLFFEMGRFTLPLYILST